MKTWEVKRAGRDAADVAQHFKKSKLEKLRSLDFHLEEVKHRYKRLGL